MLELEDRLRRLAGEHERAARVPPASATVRRGRRRRRRLAAGATTLTVLSLLAGLVGVRELREPAVAPPPGGPAAPTITFVPPAAGSAAPGTTIVCRPGDRGPACDLHGSTVVQRGFEPVEGKVVATGEQPGYRWRLVIRRHKLPDGQHELAAFFERDDFSPPVDLVTLEPVRLSLVFPTTRFPNMHGIVTDRAALIRLRPVRGGALLAPIEVRPTDGGPVFPHNAWFVAFLPKGSELYRIELLDRQGRPICSERVKKVKLPGGSETIPGGSCF